MIFFEYIVSIFILLLLFFSIKPIGKLWFKFKWSKIKNQKLPENYLKILNENFHPYKFLSDEEKERFHLKILYFLKYKNLSVLQDFLITPEMKVMIAAQACLLILNIEGDIYPSLVNIFLSIDPFIEKENFFNVYNSLPYHVPRAGESRTHGPVVLAWSSVAEGMNNWFDGQNVVFHEFAHQLDALGGVMDGTPKLQKRVSLHKWKIFMTREFLELRKNIQNHHKSDIDTYGATNSAEFFAVTVEEFFEKSIYFKKNHPDIFKLYLDFFQIDPTRWAKV